MTGEVIADRFKIVSQIGSGGMGVVYRAEDTVLERPVAIKVLNAECSSDTSFTERFFNEAKIIAQLSTHPHVVNIYDVGLTPEDQPYLVMEFLPGGSLDTLLQGWSPPTRGFLVDMGLQISSALFDAHRRGVMHRDLKPANVFFVQEMGLNDLFKVLDFGLARSASKPLSQDNETKRGMLFGTPRYMAPEHLDGDDYGPAGDMYALGMILYELSTGRYPYSATTTAGYLRAHTEEEPAEFPEFESWTWQSFGEHFVPLVMSMLAKQPDHRPNLQKVIGDLRDIADRLHADKR